ncbi:WD repeat: SAM and U-box domain-containing protein 1-like protein [Leptotrombidium deliense]|uniref:WD repeat, SAM and U-box domain-containing protein 1 n=1 Tax=Leptotrombidium deliense TaxID=299467 RepID=A0A443SS77_9ACAR|nr:WD repeat: SAM and U-box domain-containing protein 1-like protein [Leptotrombidium deliense]
MSTETSSEDENGTAKRQILTGHSSDVTFCDFSGSRLLVSSSNDKTVRVWKVAENGLFKECTEPPLVSPLVGHKYSVNCVRFSPFGTIIASCSTDGNVILWNVQNGDQVVKLQHPSNCVIRTCCFSPSSAILVSGGDDETLCLWDISTRSLICSLEGHEAMITACDFTPDSSYLISGSTAGDLRLWDSKLGNGKCLEIIAEAHDLGVLGTAFSPEYEVNVSNGPLQSFYLLASCGSDDLTKLWQVKIGVQTTVSLSHVLSGHTGNVNSCRFSNDGLLLATAAGDKLVILWDPHSGEMLYKLEGHSRYATCCVFSADNSLLATGSNDKTIIIWNLNNIDAAKISPAKRQENIDNCNNGENAAKTAIKCLGNNTSSVSQWKVEDVINWLDTLGMGQYSDLFRQSEIDGTELLHLSHDTLLTSMKIDALGHRNKIIRGLQALRNPLWQHIAVCGDETMAMPDELYCPITHEFMHDPVVASDGYSYERQAITEWFEKGNSSSPMTNEPLDNRTLVTNLTLKLLIKKYISP